MVKNVKDAEGLLRFAADESVSYVDFRFTDYKCKWHHVAFHISALDEDMLEDGLMIDGSSIAILLSASYATTFPSFRDTIG